VKVGDTVTFKGGLAGHPLSASMRGDQPNPITETKTGTDKTVTFTTAGTFAFFCEFHGSADDGTGMAGAIWVTP
jgi:plastocyanin